MTAAEHEDAFRLPAVDVPSSIRKETRRDVRQCMKRADAGHFGRATPRRGDLFREIHPGEAVHLLSRTGIR